MLACALTGDQTHNLGISGQHSNELSHRASTLILSSGNEKHPLWTILPEGFLPEGWGRVAYLLPFTDAEKHAQRLFLGDFRGALTGYIEPFTFFASSPLRLTKGNGEPWPRREVQTTRVIQVMHKPGLSFVQRSRLVYPNATFPSQLLHTENFTVKETRGLTSPQALLDE